MKKRCRHQKKYHCEKNCLYEECHGYHLAEYDIYCSKCGEYLGHWAYGSFEPELEIKYVLKGLKKYIGGLDIIFYKNKNEFNYSSFLFIQSLRSSRILFDGI